MPAPQFKYYVGEGKTLKVGTPAGFKYRHAGQEVPEAADWGDLAGCIARREIICVELKDGAGAVSPATPAPNLQPVIDDLQKRIADLEAANQALLEELTQPKLRKAGKKG